MDTRDFERLKESVRQMVAVKKGEAPVPRSEVFSGKILIEIKEHGEPVWTIHAAANALKEAVVEGSIEFPSNPGEHIRLIRERLRQTQEGFAELLDIPLPTLRNWEQGRRLPHGPAYTLIRVVSRHPDAVLDAVDTERTLEVACP